MDALHDLQQTRIDFLARPGNAGRVLAHFQARRGHAARIAGLARRIQHAGRLERLGRLDGGRHVGAFGHALHAIGDEKARIVDVQFILRGAGQGDVDRHMPWRHARFEAHARAFGVVADPAVQMVLDLHQNGQLFRRETVLVDDGAARIGDGDDFRAHGHGFFHRVLRHVARTGHGDAHAFERAAPRFQHFLCKIHGAVARRFRPHQRAAKAGALAREHAVGAVAEFFHHAGHITHFAPAHADVAGRHVRVRAHMTEQFTDESLAETHHFARALALRIEIGAALAAAHR